MHPCKIHNLNSRFVHFSYKPNLTILYVCVFKEKIICTNKFSTLIFSE